jgi:thiol-disulfide isomerase/thioredoxin
MRPILYPFLLAPALLAGCDRAAEAPKSPDQPIWQGPRGALAAPTGRLDRDHAGAPAPAAAFLDPNGRETSLSDFRGRPLLVNLWATWCAPCVVEMPTLDALAGREDGRVQVLAISMDMGEGGRAKVDRFFAERSFAALEPYLDPELGLMAELGVSILPTTILYDAEGREVWRMTGMEDWQSDKSAALIAEGFRLRPDPNPAAAR